MWEAWRCNALGGLTKKAVAALISANDCMHGRIPVANFAVSIFVTSTVHNLLCLCRWKSCCLHRLGTIKYWQHPATWTPVWKMHHRLAWMELLDGTFSSSLLSVGPQTVPRTVYQKQKQEMLHARVWFTYGMYQRVTCYLTEHSYCSMGYCTKTMCILRILNEPSWSS